MDLFKNRIFLCVSNNYNNNFKCSEFESFKEADKKFKDLYINRYNLKSTMVSVPSYIPNLEYVNKQFLNYELYKIFNKQKIHIIKSNN